MTIEDRLRKAFRAGSPERAPERAWTAIEEWADRRGRLRRRVRWAAWLAPVVVAAVGVPAYEALAPAGHPARVVTTTPTSTATPAATASPIGTLAPAPQPTSGPVTLSVKACPIQYSVLGNPPIVPPATVTVTSLPAGDALAAYGGTMVLLGPTGWACDGWAYADGGLELAVHPPGEELPINPSQAATETVQAIIGFLPSPMTGVSSPWRAP